jgi:CheY-like chemotaxis protein
MEFKVSVLPTPAGEEVTIRFPQGGPGDRYDQDRALSVDLLNETTEILGRKEGLFLICGPLGSGRTAKLCGWARELAREPGDVAFLSDSIEEEIEGVKLFSVSARTGVTFARALRGALLHGAKVIVIDELRDGETAEIALRASLEGCLVLASLHTTDCASALTRLWDLKVKRDLLSAALSGILAQQLVRALCPACREERGPLPSVLFQNVPMLYRAKGCSSCGQTGYRGRVALHEFLAITPDWRERIARPDLTEADVRRELSIANVPSLQAKALEALKAGLTTVDELERNGLVPSDALAEPQSPEPALPEAAAVPQREDPTPDGTLCAACGRHLPPIRKEEDDYQGFKILLAEDDPSVSGMVSKLLSNEGFQVLVAPNGRAAWEDVLREKPHLIITDILMPEMTGLDLIKKLRGDVTTVFIPVMILSQKKDVEDRIRGFEAGTDDYLPKPFSTREMLVRIRSVLKRTYG